MFSGLDPIPDLATVYAAIPGPILLGAALGAAMPMIVGSWARFHHWWRRGILDRRLARDDYMLVEEYRDHASAIGEQPEPIDWRAITREVLVTGLLLGAGGVMIALGKEWAWEIALLGFAGLALLYGLWRKINDPQEVAEDEYELPPSDGGTALAVGFYGLLAIIALLTALT